MSAPLDVPFFARDARVVARALVGTVIVVRRDRDERVARVVETEAYCGPRDLACHARAGLTARTRTLFGPPGHAYVFLIYGMHECFNVVCLREGRGHAVLVRAAEPLAGVPAGVRADGPGRFTRALGLTRADQGARLHGPGPIHFLPRPRRVKVATSARVGVAYAGPWADKPWRFFDADSRAVSRPPAGQIGRPR